MRQSPESAGLGASAEIDDLVRRLRELVAAIDQARGLGLPVSVPTPLYDACTEVIARHDAGRSTSRSTRDMATGTPSAASSVGKSEQGGARRSHAGEIPMRDVPLRRLIWQVIDPGTVFTVADVANRLADLGVSASPTAVSNALGYLASRERLIRQRKGVYHYPVPGATPNRLSQNASQTSSAEPEDRTAQAARGEDATPRANPAKARRAG